MSRAIERILVTTGGTGGHIFPALAVVEEVRRKNPAAKALFVGSDYGPERDMAARAGVDFAALPARGFLGRGLRAVPALWRLVRSVAGAVSILRDFKPQVVVGFGGYAGVAPVVAARMVGVPCALHEQNSVPGAANRMLARLVRRVFISFSAAAPWFDAAKTVLTGNPVREEIARAATMLPEPQRVFVFGGSQGSRAINRAVVGALPVFRQQGVVLHHQTGQDDYDEVRDAYEAAGMLNSEAGCVVEPFIHDMADAYGRATLVICRSGASSVAELAVAARGAIFVPFPHATHDHQRKNAEAAVEAGGARLIDEVALTPAHLAQVVAECLPNALAMGDAMAQTAHARAAAHLVEELTALVANPTGRAA